MIGVNLIPQAVLAARNRQGEADSHRKLWQVQETISRFFSRIKIFKFWKSISTF